MTKKKNLTAFMIAIIVMLFSFPANAQEKQGYAKWDESSTTLTFYGGESVPTTGAYALNTGSNDPDWNNYDVKYFCTNVVFDASFNDVRPTSCHRWFREFSKLSTIEGIEYLNTDNVKTMHAMFEGCSGLTTLDLSSFNTAKVTHMTNMFSGCSSLTSLDLSNFNTANVEYMFSMFEGCSGLTTLDLSSFNTAKVVSMFYMFYGCSKLTSLDLSSFNTAKVADMGKMFYGCSKLPSLDLSSFNTAKVTDMGNMFYGCSDLTKIYVSNDFSIGDDTSGSNMFTGCASLKGAVSYNSGKTGIDMANFDGYFTESNLTPYVKWNADTKVLTFKVAHYIGGTEGEWKFNEGANASEWVGEVYSVCEKVVFTPSFKQAKPTSCNKWFSGFGQLTTIQGIENLNTEEVTDMSYMFGNCTGLKSLDLSSFNTANVEVMSDMFNGCSGLTTIYASDDFTTGIVTQSTGMFGGCSKLVGAAQYDSNKIDKDMANYRSGYFKTYFTLGGSKMELFGESTSLDLSGDNDFVAHAPFTVNKATYTRNLSSSTSTWFSLCLPFAYTPQNFTAYQLQSANGDAVEIEQITGEIVAGTPVLFKFKDDVVDVDKKKIEITATDAQIVKAPVDGTPVSGPNGSSLQLCGTYQKKTFSKYADDNAFILLNDKLMNPAKMLENQNVKKVGVKPFRGYMTMTSQASAKSFSIGSGDEGTTAIDLLNSVATDDAEYYDINGRRIDAPAKGVNIVRRGNKTMKLIIK